MNEITVGELKGVDVNGNQYYENLDYMSGRTRWVVYADADSNDPTTVEPIWHGWLHYTTDKTPLDRQPYIPRFYKPRQPNSLSQMGFKANHLPPGSLHREDSSVPLVYSTWKDVEANPRAMKSQHFGAYNVLNNGANPIEGENSNLAASIVSAAKDSEQISGSPKAALPESQKKSS
jgi:NADH:ubiquinone oxidoreductase subunit